MTTRFTLGNLLLIRLEKDNFIFLPENDWFCSILNVRTPEKDMIYFPCYRWMGEGEVIELREAKGLHIYLLLHNFKIYHCYHCTQWSSIIIQLGLHYHSNVWGRKKHFYSARIWKSDSNDMLQCYKIFLFQICCSFEKSFWPQTF